MEVLDTRVSYDHYLISECTRIEKTLSSDVLLFRAVISQAIVDLISDNIKLVQEKNEAKKWLLYSDKDFYHICDLAELDPKYTREKIRNFLNERQTKV